jgi:hypothetical protein
MKDLSYTTIFPNKKTISHEESLKEKVKSNIVNIIMEENKISEKAFSKFDQVINLVKDKFSEEMLKFALNELKLQLIFLSYAIFIYSVLKLNVH